MWLSRTPSPPRPRVANRSASSCKVWRLGATTKTDLPSFAKAAITFTTVCVYPQPGKVSTAKDRPLAAMATTRCCAASASLTRSIEWSGDQALESCSTPDMRLSNADSWRSTSRYSSIGSQAKLPTASMRRVSSRAAAPTLDAMYSSIDSGTKSAPGVKLERITCESSLTP